ncbi:MAG: response regulator [Methylococcales bacterium]|jgi:CheY-like chemotaxis protein|nr:response regulator [Methylococcales bacterium]MBT7445223.1 response regulator [Methylococcales bacterium]
MVEDKKRVLIVDDSADDIRVLMEILKHKYAILAATGGRKAIEIASKPPYVDVVLLDVEMPGMGGYEVCNILQSQEETKDIEVIFVSAHDTIEEKLAGYEAGGSDYIIKPVEPDVIVGKVDAAVSAREGQQKILNDKDVAFSTAMAAMTSAADLGIIVQFLRSCYTVVTEDELAQLIVMAISKFGLKCTVLLRGPNRETFSSIRLPILPLEKELLIRAKGGERIVTLGDRAVINYDSVVLLVKNMPKDEEARGRFRDSLAILVEGAVASLKSIYIAQQEILRTEKLSIAMHEANAALEKIHKSQQSHKDDNLLMINKLMNELEMDFIVKGALEEAHEKELISLIETTLNKTMLHSDHGLEIDDAFLSIIKSLDETISM